MVEVRKIESSLPIIYKTGKVLIGRNNVVWALKNEPDKIKAILMARNIPKEFEDEIQKLIKERGLKLPVIKLTKTNIEIGDLFGRAHSVSMVAIYNLGSAPISEEAFNV